MPRAPNYFKFHLGDYAKDCEELTLLQHGAYLALIRWYYATGRPLPNDRERIHRRCHALSGEEKGAVDYVLAEFFQLDGPVWKHRRIDLELAEWNERSDEARTSALTRWSNKINDNHDANALRKHCDGNANQNQEPRTKEVGSVSENTLRSARAKSREPRTDLRGTRLDPGATIPDEWKTWTIACYPTMSPQEVVSTWVEFRNYWSDVPGAKGLKLRWFQTWQNNVHRKAKA